MTYRFVADRPALEQARRIALDQLRRAREWADRADREPVESVHEVRKRIKKLRALSRLVRARGFRLRREDRALRRAGRLLSSRRDADVAAATLLAVATEYPSLRSDPGYRHACRALPPRPDPAAPVGAVLARALLQLDRFDTLLARWDPGAHEPDLHRNLERDWRRVRRRMHRARSGPSPGRVHAWRKALKTHLYQLRLLGAAEEPRLHGHLAELKRLETTLGEHRDLVRLEETLHQLDPPSDAPLEAVLEAISGMARERLESALEDGPHLLDPEPARLPRS